MCSFRANRVKSICVFPIAWQMCVHFETSPSTYQQFSFFTLAISDTRVLATIISSVNFTMISINYGTQKF